MTIRLIGLRFALAVAVSTCCGLGTANGQTETETALRTFHSANGLLNRGMHELAAAEYAAFLEAQPEHEEADVARYGLGVSLYRLARHDDAIAALAGIKVNRKGDRTFQYAAESQTLLGQCHLAEARFEDAAGQFQVVLERHADHDLADDAAALLAESLYRARRFDDVGAPCRLLIERWPESPRRDRCELFGGLAEMAAGRHADAAGRFRSLLGRSPDGVYADRATLLLAQSLHHTGAGSKAIEHYRKVVREAADELVPDALYGLAVVLYEQEQAPAAARLLDDLFERFENVDVVPAARVLRGRIHLDAGETDKAIAYFTEVAKVPGARQDAGVYWLAKCDLKRARPDAAAKRLAEALERFPKSALAPEMTYDLAVALVRAGEPDAALEILARFDDELAKNALAADALHLAATTQHQAADYEASLGSCRAFQDRHARLAPLARHALSESIAFLAAENLFLAGDLEEAVAAYRSFLDEHEASPQRGSASYRLGMALHGLGRFEEAEPILADVIENAEADSPFRNAVLVLGDLAFQRGDWAEAEAQLADYLAGEESAAGVDDALMKLGLARHRLGRVEEAIEAYTQLIDRFPESAHRLQATFERGQALVTLDRDDDAVADFRRVLSDGPESRFAVYAFNHLASIAAQSGESEEAASWYELAARATDDDALRGEALFQRAQALLAQERYEEAAEVLSSLIDDHSRHERTAAAYGHLAIALARLGRHEAALAAVEKIRKKHASKLDPALLAAVTYEEAWSLRSLDREDAAADAYRRLLRGGSLESAGKNGDEATVTILGHSRLELAELEANEERFDEAVALLRPIADEALSSSKAHREIFEQASYRLGVYEYSNGDFKAAAERLGRFVEAHPKSDLGYSAHLLAGESLLSLGAHKRAEAHLRKAAESGPEHETCGPALLRLGECLAVLQHWARSEETFQVFLRSFPESELWFQARFGEGWARENQDRYDDAIGSYGEVVAKHQGPTAARAQFQIGECLFAQNRFEEAALALLKVDILYAYPEWSAAALYEAGRCFQGLEDAAQAKKQFELVRANHGETNWARMAADRLDEIARAAVSTALPGH